MKGRWVWSLASVWAVPDVLRQAPTHDVLRDILAQTWWNRNYRRWLSVGFLPPPPSPPDRGLGNQPSWSEVADRLKDQVAVEPSGDDRGNFWSLLPFGVDGFFSGLFPRGPNPDDESVPDGGTAMSAPGPTFLQFSSPFSQVPIAPYHGPEMAPPPLGYPGGHEFHQADMPPQPAFSITLNQPGPMPVQPPGLFDWFRFPFPDFLFGLGFLPPYGIPPLIF